MPNRLAAESSPYLLQHKDNPVDWYPWGAEAFERAKAEDKPVFVSIGYAACHWCHVMAHESFEDEDTAALMNQLFVNVKVDREERPDVDAVYMHAIQVTGEGGGWPLSAFCTPDGKPYFLGTYFPPSDKYGRPGFAKVLRIMADVWQNQRDKVEANTEAVLDGLRQIDSHFRGGDGNVDGVDAGLLITAGRQLAQRADPVHGGLGTRPKFPSSSSHDLLGRAGRLRFGKPARQAYLTQARQMARGGIYDHLGGGFARYSVDEKWLVPHFEKMLYDNGQLLALYGDAYAWTAEPDFRRVIEETVAWLEREMLDPAGGLYASQDADSEGEEGKFYVWTPAEIRAVLGPARALLFEAAYGVTEAGNFEGKSILSRVTERGSDADEAALAEMRAELLATRTGRVPPETDTKVLAGWNALAISGLLRAWGATGYRPARELAERVAGFLAERMLHDDGARLHRVFKDGVTKLEGTIDDYAFCALAFFELAEATGDDAWWRRGTRLMETVLGRFYQEDAGTGVFYMTPADGDELLVHRPASHTDGAIPSGAAVAVECLVRMGLVAGDARAMAVAERYLAGRGPQAAEHFFSSSRLLRSVDYYLHGVELVVTGGEGADALLEAARATYAPTLMIAGSWAAPSLLEGKTSAADGRARAYVCHGQSCSAPVSDPDDLRELLAPTPDP